MRAPTSSPLIRTTKLVAVLMFCLLNPLAGWAYLHQVSPRRDRDGGRIVDTLRTHRVRVLPLDGDFDEVSGHWVERLSETLRQSHGLEVWSVMDPAVGDDSNPADFVVQGSYEREGDRVRIHAWLMLAERPEVVWLETFEGETVDVDAWCDDARLAILSALALYRN